MTPTVPVRLGESVGSQFHWLRALMGTIYRDFGPLLVEEGQKASSVQGSTIEGPPGATLLCALKCQLCIVFGQELPLSLRAPRSRGSSPGLLGPCGRQA